MENRGFVVSVVLVLVAAMIAGSFDYGSTGYAQRNTVNPQGNSQTQNTAFDNFKKTGGFQGNSNMDCVCLYKDCDPLIIGENVVCPKIQNSKSCFLEKRICTPT